jgi:hypothetical protein
MKNEIKKIFIELQKCYLERNAANIDKLADTLFDKNSSPVVIGTSNNEIFFGYEESKKIFLEDWKSWGNVSFDMDTLEIIENDTLINVSIKAGVEYNFYNTEETYKNFMGFVKEVAENKKSHYSKSAETIWLLSHLLHERADNERKYIWDMNITGIIKNTTTGYKFEFLQFSIPTSSQFPDARIDAEEYDKHSYNEESKKIKNFNETIDEDRNLKEKLSEIFNNSDEILFSSDNLKRFMCIDSSKKDSKEFKEYLELLKTEGTLDKIEDQNIILFKTEKSFSFFGISTYTKKINPEKELNKIFDKIKKDDYEGDNKDKLFKIRRDLSFALKEIFAAGNEMISPIRIQGMGTIKENQLIIDSFEISYPFNCILEEKTDLAIKK